MRFAVHKRRSPPAVIIVSLIDILIVLLIFMMVTTTFKEAPALRITLPEAQMAEARPGGSENPPITVTITTNQPYLYLGRLPVTWDRLRNEFAEQARTNPNVSLVIRGDSDAAYGNVVKVIVEARHAQIKQIKAFVKPTIGP